MQERRENTPDEEDYKILKAIGYEAMDIANKWGPRFTQIPHIAILRSQSYVPTRNPVTIISDTRSDRQAVFIRNGDHEGLGFHNLSNKEIAIPLIPGKVEQTSPLGITYVLHKQEGFISIDPEVLPYLADVLTEMDKWGIKNKLYSPKGTRIPVPEQYVALPSFKVDEVFSDSGTLYPVLDENADKLIKQFDKPDELTVFVNFVFSHPVEFIIKTSDLDLFNKRNEIFDEVLTQNHIDPRLMDIMLSDLQVFYPVLANLRDEVDKRLDQWKKENKDNKS